VAEDTPVTEPRPQRQLSAILAADVAGYSRLIGLDEEGTLARLKELRRTLIDPKINEHRGRIVKTMGDGLLVQFASAVDAVRCAVDIQRGVAEQNAGTDEERRIEFRIGINVGDVVVDGEDIHGDGVNVAARLEGLSDPGGIYLSQIAHDHVLDKLDIAFDDLGEQRLKNIARPVRVYRTQSFLPSSGPIPKLSSKPSIAVLPFENMSGNPDEQYFADGVTEDIITELSRYRSLFVIARHTSFQYRGKSLDVRHIGRDLGVGFVVEGSVRRSGQQLRITAQLIDANSGDHVWAERYARDLQDVFAVQDEVARTIAATLEGRVAASAVEKSKRKPTKDLQAYDYLLQGRERDHVYDMNAAEAYFGQAVALDPNYAQAHAFRAIALAVMHWGSSDFELLHRADASAQKALSIDPHDPLSHQAAGYIALCQRKFDLAGTHLNRAAKLNPNDAMIAADQANWLVRTGKPQEALTVLDAAMQRDPYPAAWMWEMRYRALFHLHRYDEAITTLNNVPSGVRNTWRSVYFAAALALANRLEEARTAISNFTRLVPGASISMVSRTEPYSDPQFLEHFLNGLRKAGLPE
jgi:TolB-like protein/class 3 adenylate cyclase